MNGMEKIVTHLEMTQAVINRLGSNSSQLKGWSMTLIVAAMVLLARYDLQNPTIILAFILPILDSGRLLSVAGEVVPRGLRRDQAAGRHRLQDGCDEAPGQAQT